MGLLLEHYWLLTDLFKAFDGIPQDLIIAKLEAYGFHTDALKLNHDYMSNRKQRIKVTWSFIIQYTFMWSILFLEDLDISCYADEIYTIYMVNEKKSQSLVH